MSYVFWTASCVFIADRITKIVIYNTLSGSGPVAVIPGIFHLTLVLNKGVAFGLFRDQQAFFIVFSVIAALSLTAYALIRRAGDPLFALSLGLVLGGALGNLADRLRFGCVIDFLDFRIWPVFNVADSCITVGAVILALRLLKHKT
ncbi:MAG: signal peptidase II [Candidatus Omnitrophota bacterium]